MSSRRVGDDALWFSQHLGLCQGFKLTLSTSFSLLVSNTFLVFFQLVLIHISQVSRRILFVG